MQYTIDLASSYIFRTLLSHEDSNYSSILTQGDNGKL